MGKLSWIALRPSEYSLGDMMAWLKGVNRGSCPMWNSSEYQSFNALEDITRVDVPVYFFNGRQDYNTPLSLTQRYFDVIAAPRGKKLVIFDASVHTSFIGEADKFNLEMIRVKNETQSTFLSP